MARWIVLWQYGLCVMVKWVVLCQHGLRYGNMDYVLVATWNVLVICWWQYRLCVDSNAENELFFKLCMPVQIWM